MLEFKIIQEFEPNEELIKTFKECNFKYRVKKGLIKECLHTNLHFVVPTIYLITYPTECIIHEYHLNEISNKNFYIREHNQKYNLKEIIRILIKLH